MLEPFLRNWPAFAVGLFLLLLFRILASPRFKGWSGERMVVRGLRRLDPATYRCHHDVYLPRPDGPGTTQIDHVVVSPHGIFVIETKNYRGWIFGSPDHRQWTQQIYRSKRKFQNPIHQNMLHVRALAQFLSMPVECFVPVVFFIGDATFKTTMPGNVINRGLVSWITAREEVLLEPGQVAEASRKLEEHGRATDRRTVARAHVAALKAGKDR